MRAVWVVEKINEGAAAERAVLLMATKRRSGWTRIAEQSKGDLGDKAESETQRLCAGLQRAMKCCRCRNGHGHSYDRSVINPITLTRKFRIRRYVPEKASD